MNFYYILSKRNLSAVLLFTVIAVFTAGQVYAAANIPENAGTNALRISFISSLNFTMQDETPAVKEIKIPYNFSKVYENYNKLQQKAGYNLKDYCGKSATVYTYKLKDGYYANLIVYKNRIIGGDICSNNLYGEMKPLKKDSP